MRAARFLALSTLSNLWISLTYAAVGALSANRNAFLPALAGSMLLPWLVLLAAKRHAVEVTAERNATLQEDARNDHY
jgi:hypothetical protein